MVKPFVTSLLLVGASFLTSSASAQDTQRWRLDFEADAPKYVSVQDAQGAARSIWYVTYRVKNESGAERPLALGFRFITDLKDPKDLDKPLTYKAQINPEAKKAVEQRLGKELAGIADIAGAKIGDGDTVEGIVTFGELNPNVDQLDLEVRGLVDPLSREGDRAFVERKVYLIHFNRKGDEFLVTLDTVKKKSAEWKVLSREEVPLPKKYGGR